MATPENTAGNQSGETVLIPGTGESAPFAAPQGEINGTYSAENQSAKWKTGSQDVPAAGQNQYQ